MTFIRQISGSPASDDSLIDAFKKSGDQAMVARLLDRYIEMVYAVCLKYLKDQEAAKDAVMEIFGQLSIKLAQHEVTNFKSWLYTLVKNHCLMQLRTSSRVKAVNLDENVMQFSVEMHPDADSSIDMQVGQLSGCIEKLSADQRQVISLFYLEEKSYKEITEIAGMDWNKVRSLVQNGRRNLKICMEQHNKQTADKG